MRLSLLILIVLSACATLTAACAPIVGSIPPVTPPRRDLPASVRAPCALTILGSSPTFADLEAAYVRRGVDLLVCDAARRTSVDVHDGEHADEDAWLQERLK